MRNQFVIIGFGIFLLFGCPAYAAESAIDDRGTLTVNHNYFAAPSDPQLKYLLFNVELNHIDHSPTDPDGVMGNIRKGKYNYAIADLNYTLERFVNHPKALSLLNFLAKVTNDRFLPISYYERAITLYPGYAFTHAQYGGYLVEIGDLTRAITQLQKAIELDPKLAIAHAALAKAYSRSGKPDLAKSAAKEARDLGYKERAVGEGAEE